MFMTPEAAVAQLAASLFAHEIDASILASLQQPETAGVLRAIEPSSGDLLEREWMAEDFEKAALEFRRLFIREAAVPVRAEVYEKKDEPEVAGRIQFMLDSGFLELPVTYRTLAPDHLALLLLVYSSLEGEDAKQFKVDNLSWLPKFSERLKKEAGHPFYRLAARILQVV